MLVNQTTQHILVQFRLLEPILQTGQNIGVQDIIPDVVRRAFDFPHLAVLAAMIVAVRLAVLPVCAESHRPSTVGAFEQTGKDLRKAFPHNLRHLFATAFYRASRDIVRLADVLGHSSIETTRIYLLTCGDEHQRLLDCLGFVS